MGAVRELWDLETGEEIAKPRKGNKPQRAFEQADNSKNPATPCCSPLAAPTSTCCSPLAAPRLEWTAMGNPFLLEAPLLASVRISTATPPDILAELVAKLGARAERGVVLVSPWISPGEKAVKAEALARGGRVVQLLPDGMERYYKPSGGDFNFCAEGRMLVISPFAPRQEGAQRTKYGKARFEWLNRVAQAIADIAAGFSRAQLQGLRQADNSKLQEPQP